jgi:hypothetical protein
MTKLAICIKSCHRDMDAGYHDAIRTTWGRDAKALGIDLYFFMGKDPTQQDTRRVRRYVTGEIVLDCADDYDSLPIKTRRICQWVQAKMYQYLFLCDNDTFVKPKLLLQTDFKNFDYAGDFFANNPGQAPFKYTDERGLVHPECRAWASGGFGYFLSRRATEGIAAVPPVGWAEDFYAGQVMAPAIDANYITAASFHFRDEGTTEHWNKRITTKLTPEIIRLAYEHGGFKNLFVKGLLAP